MPSTRSNSIPAVAAPLVLYKNNRRDSRFELPVASAVLQFRQSEFFGNWQLGWPLMRSVGAFIAYTLNAVPEDIAADSERLADAILTDDKARSALTAAKA